MKARFLTASLILAAMTASAAELPAPPKGGLPPRPPAVSVPVPSPTLEESKANYDLCLSLARSYPAQGFEFAGNWKRLAGGEPARHCEAVAMIGLGQYAEAGKRLEELAAGSKQIAEIRAGMLAQAGQAWFLDGKNDRAYAAQTQALKVAPPSSFQVVDILIDRAATLAEMSKYDEVVIDLTAAIGIDPNNSDAYTFRANANRYLDKMNWALRDAEKAVQLNSKNSDALLMRGVVYLDEGRPKDARYDWQKVIEIAPDSDAAKAAHRYLAKLDAENNK